MAARRPGAGRTWRAPVAVACLVVAAAIAAGCSSEAPAPAADAAARAAAGEGGPGAAGGVLRMAAVGIDTLDPADALLTNPSAMILADALFDPLTAADPAGGDARPAIASSWRHDDDLREWTFTIRDGATFSDGSPVTARDAVLTLARLARRGRSSVAGSRLDVIDGVADFAAGRTLVPAGMLAVDPRTVRLTTTAPFAGLPELLSSPVFGIVPEKAVNAPGGTFGQAPVTSGPFAVGSRDGDVIHLVRAPGSSARLAGVDVALFDDEAAAYDAFAAGKADWAPVPAGEADGARGVAGARVQVRPSASVMFVAANTRRAPLAEESTRVALAQAVDRRSVVAATPGISPAGGLVPADLPGWSPGEGCGAPCTVDAAAAAAAVAAAPVPPLRLTYYDEADDATTRKAASVLLDQWRAVGVRVEGDPRPFGEARLHVLGPDAELFVYGWVGVGADPDAWLAPLVAQGSVSNVTGWSSPAEEDALRAARALPDRGERLRAYAEVQRRALAAAAMVPIGALDLAVVTWERVRGADLRWDGTIDVVAVELVG